MEIKRLFANMEIDWQRLNGPRIVREVQSPTPEPSLRNIQPKDLSSIPALRTLYDQAVRYGLFTDSEANFVSFISTAAYCRRVGENPAALFVYLVNKAELTSALQDEDRAIRELKEWRTNTSRTKDWLVMKRPAVQAAASAFPRKRY
ncbi:MAG: hypothetical protein GC190_19995 [Alphaproteobacteria bacterium]|nr:hypothetical protein [Alphaproteobacteria bacterium]